MYYPEMQKLDGMEISNNKSFAEIFYRSEDLLNTIINT